MDFTNEMTKAVSSDDENHLRGTTLIVRCLRKTASEQIKKNPKWRTSNINCHSIARLISIFLEECRLVDGYLMGLHVNEEEKIFQLQHTCHSWIETPDKSIIDPYPMGLSSIGSVIIVPQNLPTYRCHGYNLYKETSEVKNHFDESVSWQSARSLKRLLRKNCPDEMIHSEAKYLSQL